MRVLAVYAHPDPRSFCHAVLEEFTRGLQDAGHALEVVELYAIKFDPVFRQQDMASYLHEDIPREILETMNLKQRVLDSVPGGPIGRFVAARRLRHMDAPAVAKLIREHAPRDAREQWEKVARADGLAFIAALVINTTLFCEEDYKADWEEPMSRIIDDWGLRYPGVKSVEHVYLYEVAIADAPRLEEYLRRAYALGREFATTSPSAGPGRALVDRAAPDGS